MGKSLDMDGKRFGMLTATNRLKIIPFRSRGMTVRLCYCDCGKETWVVTTKIHNGHTTSCGCHKLKSRALSPGRAARNQILDGYKRGARKRGFEWSLTESKFDILTTSKCYYCGCIPSTTKRTRGNNGDFVYNGIDRVDNSLGYVVSNCVTCCEICNRAKRHMLYDDFLDWILQLVNYRGSVVCGS